MSEHEVDEYLWGGPGSRSAPDPDVRRLEGLLGRYRWQGGGIATEPRGRIVSFPFRTAAAIAAGILAAALIFWAVRRGPESGYRLTGIEGRDVVRTGEEIATDAAQNARLEISWLGHVDVEPNTRLRVEDCGESSHRLFLSRGSVSAKIWAQPRLFRIGSPAGETIDLGCAYRLDVAPGGPDGLGGSGGDVSTLRVTTGQVAFEFEGREIYVPAGAVCVSVKGRGPAAPVFEDASAEFKAAVAEAEFAPACGADLVRRVIDLAEREDTLTLWHLFDSPRVEPALRRAAFEKLSAVFPKPRDATDAGLLAGEHGMRGAWMEEMKAAWR